MATRVMRNMRSKSSEPTTTMLPLLDLGLWQTNPLAFCAEFQQACHEIGFFLLRVPRNYYHNDCDINKGPTTTTTTPVSSLSASSSPHQIATRALHETKTFFETVSMSDKRSISYQHNASFRGYMACGVENTAGRVDLREQVEYARDYNHHQCPSHHENTTHHHHHHDDKVDEDEPFYKRLTRAPNPWPSKSIQPTLQPAIMAHVDMLLDISLQLRRAFCLSLLYHPIPHVPHQANKITNGSSIDEVVQRLQQRLDDEFVDPHWVVKLVAYSSSSEAQQQQQQPQEASSPSSPQQQQQQQQQLQQGVGAHTDTNFLTLVLQDDVGGLQVFLKDEWIHVPTTRMMKREQSIHHNHDGDNDRSSSSSDGDDDLILVCNLGESAQLYSGGYFCATPHRVVLKNNSQNERSRRRISVPFFLALPSFFGSVKCTVGHVAKS
jgi:isopenicillin N synthase-like dioxygenase